MFALGSAVCSSTLVVVSARRDAFHNLLGALKAEIRPLISSLTVVLSLTFVLGLVLG